MSETCETCKYFFAYGDPLDGWDGACVIEKYKVQPGEVFIPKMPPMLLNDGCGEHQPKEPTHE